jgi:Protein of unknown function (DUF2911)
MYGNQEGTNMSRSYRWLVLAVSLLSISAASSAQTSVAGANTSCDFDANKQLAVEYDRVELPTKKKVLGNSVPYGKVWAPGDKPLTLFANTPFAVGGKSFPNGAYTMFLLPEQKSWTLIISKGTDTSGKYDEAQDLARIPMQFGELPQSEPAFTAYFAHVAANQCNLRLDLEKVRSWVVFEQK